MSYWQENLIRDVLNPMGVHPELGSDYLLMSFQPFCFGFFSGLANAFEYIPNVQLNKRHDAQHCTVVLKRVGRYAQKTKI